MSACPNCGAAIKPKGLLSSGNFLVQSSDPRYQYISYLWENDSSQAPESLCDECVGKMYNKALVSLESEIESLDKELLRLSSIIPTLSIALPNRWEYKALGIVTGQVVAGTGLLSELATGWSDFWGTNSNTLASKVSGAEKSALAQLQAKTLRIGGNAVIGIDLDYAEVGGLKGMMMVCATGTAVVLENIELLGIEWEVKFRDLEAKMARRRFLATHRSSYKASN